MAAQDIAEWKTPQWAGTLRQLHDAAELALPKVRNLAPFPDGYEAGQPWRPESPYDAARHKQWMEADAIHSVGVVVEERGGYTHHAEDLDYLLTIPEHSITDIVKVAVTIGRGGVAPPGVAIRVSTEAGLAVQVVGYERTWTAGLRHELEKALRCPWRLRAPLPFPQREPYIAAGVPLLIVSIAFNSVLRHQETWEEPERVGVALGAGVVASLAFAWVIWASALRLELVTRDGQPRYQRWRRRVTGALSAILIALAASFIYALVS